MNTTLSTSAATEEQFGRQVAARLTAGAEDLPHQISERLRAARTQAVARRKVVRVLQTAPAMVPNGGTAALGGGWWTRVGSIIPLIALVSGLIVITSLQEDSRTDELAEVDAALLTDDLPPAAYTDPGFAQFLKSEGADVQR
ncbi:MULTISPECIES: DUF3619 family protein [unclassified Variovorax]|uniref:DUF3619 family protein n=1 Tax=unclassified Variovorax TaxID=663243 RepID=UPI00076DCC89|nr:MULTISPECIES: DUF3619 family protein [unclassified Variovorax]KWT72128.1 putative transmembrane protein [Variovorax sp. WDL1]PNG56429.1 hypothetical protein CHC07_02846 [Variovorax sp. B4]PNG57852.1 hypothetical protein CHC06_02848 [Variovorax sp. B2]VTV09701.1 hypothetical protein WDL1CHR_00779 [Variovorax sp. WDL1]